jgi:hypothetical protein
MGVKGKPQLRRVLLARCFHHALHEIRQKEPVRSRSFFVCFVYFVVKISNFGFRLFFGLQPSDFGLS